MLTFRLMRAKQNLYTKIHQEKAFKHWENSWKNLQNGPGSSSSSSNLYFARVIPSIQTVLLSIGALEFKNLQYTFKNLLQPIYKMQGTFTNI